MTNLLNPNSTCVLILRADGKVLACSRKDDENAFGLPGGKVDKEDPSLLCAALRELQEETGIDLSFSKPDWHYDYLSIAEQEEFGMNIIPIYSGICQGGKSGKTYINHCFMVIGMEKHITPKQIEGEGRVAWIDPELLFLGPFRDYNKKVFSHIGYDCEKNFQLESLNYFPRKRTEEELLERIEVV